MNRVQRFFFNDTATTEIYTGATVGVATSFAGRFALGSNP